jgi:hypothetical protein
MQLFRGGPICRNWPNFGEEIAEQLWKDLATVTARYDTFAIQIGQNHYVFMNGTISKIFQGVREASMHPLLHSTYLLSSTIPSFIVSTNQCSGARSGGVVDFGLLDPYPDPKF